MSEQDATVAQIFDKLAENVIGPVLGTVTATTSAGVVILPQGQTGTIPDGRRVRVRRGKRITTTATPVSVRLEWLTPAYPRASNFQPVTAGTVVTWEDPPAGITATGLVSVAFAKSAYTLPESGLPLPVFGAVAEHERVLTNVDQFYAGLNGNAGAILQAPESLDWTRGTTEHRIQATEWRWKLQVSMAIMKATQARRVLSRQIYAALCATLQGATCGDDPVRFLSWKPLTSKDASSQVYELQFATHQWSEGRVMQPQATASLPDFTTVGSKILLPLDGTQTPDFRVEEDVAT